MIGCIKKTGISLNWAWAWGKYQNEHIFFVNKKGAGLLTGLGIGVV